MLHRHLGFLGLLALLGCGGGGGATGSESPVTPQPTGTSWLGPVNLDSLPNGGDMRVTLSDSSVDYPIITTVNGSGQLRVHSVLNGVWSHQTLGAANPLMGTSSMDVSGKVATFFYGADLRDTIPTSGGMKLMEGTGGAWGGEAPVGPSFVYGVYTNLSPLLCNLGTGHLLAATTFSTNDGIQHLGIWERANGSWSTSQQIDSPNGLSDLRLGLTSGGYPVTATWLESMGTAPGGGTATRLMFNRNSGSSWTQPAEGFSYVTKYGEWGGGIYPPVVFASGNLGFAVHKVDHQLYARAFDGIAWGSPELIGGLINPAGIGGDMSAHLALAADGARLVAWQDNDYQGFQTRLYLNGQWQAARLIPEPGAAVLGVKILSRDKAFLFYTKTAGNQEQVLVQEYQSGTWLSPKPLMADSMITGGLVGQTASGKVFLCVRSFTAGSPITTLNAFVTP